MASPVLSTFPAESSPDLASSALKLLVDTGLLLAREQSLDVILQTALQAGMQLTVARFGAFFHAAPPGSTQRWKVRIAGTAAEESTLAPFASPNDLLITSLFGNGILRCTDIASDAHFGPGTPFAPLTSGLHPVRSYFAIPVHNSHAELLGGLLFCHPEVNVFHPQIEPIVVAVAAQAAVAMDNVRLQEKLRKEVNETGTIRQLQLSTDRRLRQALDAAQLGTFGWDRSTDMLDADERAAELFGIQPHVPVARSALRDRLVIEEDRAQTVDNLNATVTTGVHYNAEFRILSTTGAQMWLASTGVPTHAKDGVDVTGMIGTVQDVTLRKTQETALRQSEKLAATGRLAATIAHEINNPLEAVTNLIYLVKTDPTVPSAAQQLLETADQELARVAQIAQQTLGFYRDTTRPVDIEIDALLHGVVDLFHRKLTYKKIDCKLDLAPDLHIFGLQGELRQVFSNLVVNAIDASFGGRLLIRARPTRSGVSVLICDQGTGIPIAARERLFSPFFTTKQSVGTGLGLWVTRGILEKQGGSIRFRTSTEKPAGTTFRVFLPGMPQNLETKSPLSQVLQ